MNEYLLFDQVGEIKSHMRCSEEEAATTAETLGFSYIESGPAHPAQFFVLDGQVVAKTPAGPASVEHEEIAEPTLLEVQNRRWASIKAQRDYMEHAGFDTAYGRFDSDPTSQMKLIGASLAAQVALEDWLLTWTLQDNTIVDLTAQQVVEVGQNLLEHQNHVHTIGRTLRAAIYAEDATVESVNAVAWI